GAARMGATVFGTLLGLALHPFVILVTSAALALVVAGLILVVTTPGARRLLGGSTVIAGFVAWIWTLVDGDAIILVIVLALGTAISTLLALLALRPRPYRPPPRAATTPRKPFILMNPRSGGGKVAKFQLDTKGKEGGAAAPKRDP